MMIGGVAGSFVKPGLGTGAGIVIGGVGGNWLGQRVGAERARGALGRTED